MIPGLDLTPSAAVEACGLCLKPLMPEYTCPRCNVRYCSLSCYKSQKHSYCAESFYKDSIYLNLDQQKPELTEREKLAELMKEPDFSYDSDADSDVSDSFFDRFGAVDLENASEETIWSLLSAKERAKFLKIVKDETKIERLAQTSFWKPWWLNLDKKLIGSSLIEDAEQHIDIPRLIAIPRSLKELGVNPEPKLLFSILQVVIAYAYLARKFNGDWSGDCFTPLAEYAPSLQQNHKQLYGNITEALNSISSTLVSRCMNYGKRDRLHIITSFADGLILASNWQLILLTLSDIHCNLRGSNERSKVAQKKLEFYMAYIRHISADFEQKDRLINIVDALNTHKLLLETEYETSIDLSDDEVKMPFQ